MGNDTSRNKQGKIKIKNSSSKKKMKLIGALGTLGIMTIIPGMEYRENQIEKKIESDANIDAMRSFRNIKKEKMGKYLEAEMESLYENYPDLDSMILDGTEETAKIEFIRDIYRLYKAFMVDKSEKEVDIDDVKVKRRDQIILQSDVITEEDEAIARTYKEQYKMITDSYIMAMKSVDEKDATQLAKQMYELLALELGVKDNVLTSEGLQEVVEKEGFYYDQQNNIVFTAEGRGHVVFDKIYDKEEQTEEVAKKDEGFEIDD